MPLEHLTNDLETEFFSKSSVRVFWGTKFGGPTMEKFMTSKVQDHFPFGKSMGAARSKFVGGYEDLPKFSSKNFYKNVKRGFKGGLFLYPSSLRVNRIDKRSIGVSLPQNFGNIPVTAKSTLQIL